MSYFLFGAWNGVAALALRRDALAVASDRVEQAVIEAGLTLLDGLMVDGVNESPTPDHSGRKWTTHDADRHPRDRARRRDPR